MNRTSTLSQWTAASFSKCSTCLSSQRKINAEVPQVVHAASSTLPHGRQSYGGARTLLEARGNNMSAQVIGRIRKSLGRSKRLHMHNLHNPPVAESPFRMLHATTVRDSINKLIQQMIHLMSLKNQNCRSATR